MNQPRLFQTFFQDKALVFLHRIIDLALEEDGSDFTSDAVFTSDSEAGAVVKAKQEAVIAGLPAIGIILGRIPGSASVSLELEDGATAQAGQTLARIQGSARQILKAERVILNFVSRLSGIATLTRQFCLKLEGTGVILLDTRKTTPGMRYPEKYAVLAGGANNHRHNLESMLMLKDNHIDMCGSISKAVKQLRTAYAPCPPIEVECRSVADVHEAVSSRINRIMLDNMNMQEMRKALAIIPENIESEISGRVDLSNLEQYASLKPTYISSGAITHSAMPIDLSMEIEV